jgi:hypothetical protein
MALPLLLLTGTGSAGVGSWRTIDGRNNSTRSPMMGAAGTPLARLAGHMYEDFISTPSGGHRPSARAISNAVSDQSVTGLNSDGLSDFVWLWGQFVDHDIDLTEAASPAEPFNIAVPRGDRFFDPASTGSQTIGLSRSAWKSGSGTSRSNPRRQMNSITAWIDASNVYGSDETRASALRAGRGRLRMGRRKMLPNNTAGLPNAGGTSAALYLAGDIRANEQVGLTAMHTLWVREHNRIAKSVRANNPGMSGQEIYQRARAKVGALIQAITYNEFLPALLGPDALRPYKGLDAAGDASIAQEFSTAAYRFGHSMVSPQILRLRANGRTVARGNLSLRDAFFNPSALRETGLEPVFRGLAAQQARQIDPMVIDELRNFLFGPPGAGGFDLVSLNIQRGRDHGLASYYDSRIIFGLKPPRSFDDITSNAQLAARLEEVYGNVRNVDLWVGGLAEDHHRGSQLGVLFHTIVKDQFERLRDCDRYWYERVFGGNELREIRGTTLADVIRRNTRIRNELPDDVFRVR